MTVWVNGRKQGGTLDQGLRLAQELGSSVKGWTADPAEATAGYDMVDQRLVLIPLWLPEASTLTGVCWSQTVQGDTTADNENRIGLYTSDGATLTLVASCADDGDLWDDPAGVISKDFSATYAANTGLLYVGALYCSSAEVTAPQVAGSYVVPGHYPSWRLPANTFRAARVASSTTLPASQALSGTTTNYGGVLSFGVY